MTNAPKHGDPSDYPEIPGDSGLGDAYYDAVLPPHLKAAREKRGEQAPVAPEEKKVA